VNRRALWISLILALVVAWGSAAAMLSAGWEPKLGLDLQGGFSVVLAAPEGTDRDVLDQAVETMRRRIENLGAVQEPEISVQGDRRILVQLPGVEDRERALSAVGTTYVLEMNEANARASGLPVVGHVGHEPRLRVNGPGGADIEVTVERLAEAWRMPLAEGGGH
jgi:preprotein translocase subunit SecD